MSLCEQAPTGHYSTNLHCSSLVEYYSITVATRPDPTVRPPSRYQTGVLRCANGDFSCDLWRKIWIFRCVRVVFRNFVIMVLSFVFILQLQSLVFICCITVQMSHLSIAYRIVSSICFPFYMINRN